MGTPQIAILSMVEAVAALFIVRLWMKRPKLGTPAKLFWSAILLIPVLGMVAYGFCTIDPEEHPYDTDTTSGSAEALCDSGRQDDI
jgi:hypothetical protein